MHSITTANGSWSFNPDLSGEVVYFHKGVRTMIQGDDIKRLVAAVLIANQISRLEDMSPDEVIGSFTCSPTNS